MKRLDDQGAEISRLLQFESGYTEVSEQLEKVGPELDRKTKELAKLEEEAHLIQGVMQRAAAEAFGVELQSVTKERASGEGASSLRDVVGEFVGAFGGVTALRQERDGLKAQLEAETAARASDADARAEAEAAAATAAEQLAAAKKREAEALARVGSLEHEVSSNSPNK